MVNFLVRYAKRNMSGVEVSRDTVIEGTWQTIVRQAIEQATFPERVVSIAEVGYH